MRPTSAVPLRPQHVPDALVLGPQHPGGEAAELLLAAEGELRPEALRVLEEQPLEDSAVLEVAPGPPLDGVPLEGAAIAFGEPHAPGPAHSFRPEIGRASCRG